MSGNLWVALIMFVTAAVVWTTMRTYYHFKWKRFFKQREDQIAVLLHNHPHWTLQQAHNEVYSVWMRDEVERKRMQPRNDFLKKLEKK